MAGTDALESIAHLLATLPDEAVEPLLVTFETLVYAGGPASRPVAVQALLQAAANCANPERSQRLRIAAAALQSSQPAALTTEGLTAQQAMSQVAAIDRATWQPPPDPIYVETPVAPPEEAEEEDDEEDAFLEEAPPALPHLPVCHFFAGLVVRVAQDFADAQGRTVCSQELHKLLTLDAQGEGVALVFLRRTIKLQAGLANHEEILNNARNSWFQPVPTVDCLSDLAEWLDLRLEEEEASDEDDEGDDEDRLEDIAGLREQVVDCQDWLSGTGERGPAPRIADSSQAARIFGKDDPLTAWMAFLFAAMPLVKE